MSFCRALSAAGAEAIDAALELSVVGSFSRVGFSVRRHLFDWHDPAPGTLAGRVALVTGASSGLGEATALELAALGARVLVLGRDRRRTEAARDRIAFAVPGADLEVVIADLAHLDEVRRAADDLLERHPRVDIVVHNAGTLTHDFVTTADGLEQTAQTHVVAPFLLTCLLFYRLKSSRTRVITVTSGGMYSTRLDLDALASPSPTSFDGVKAYAQAKRAQVVLNEQFADRTRRSGVTFAAMHPGWVDTPGVRSSLPTFHRLVGPILRTPAQGVDTTRWLATEAHRHDANGRLFLDRHRRRTVHLPGTTTSSQDAHALWEWCVERSGVDLPSPMSSAAPVSPASPDWPVVGSTGTVTP